MLIDIGTDIIAEQGFNATGINAVLSRAGVPKGSFYHYFSSKEDFGLAVIDAFAEAHDRRLADVFEDVGISPLERLRRFLALGKADMASCDHSRGCLIGNLGQELSARNEVFRARLDGVLSAWERRLVDCLEQAQADGQVPADLDPSALAAFIMAGWEGAILRAKTVKSPAPMECFEEILFTRVLTPDGLIPS